MSSRVAATCSFRTAGELELGPGDAFLVRPGHNAWVVGDEPYVGVNFSRQVSNPAGGLPPMYLRIHVLLG